MGTLISYIQYNCLLRALFPQGTQHGTYTSILTCAPMYIYLFALNSSFVAPSTVVALRTCSPPSTMSTNSQATAGVWRQSRQVEVRLRTPAPVRSDLGSHEGRRALSLPLCTESQTTHFFRSTSSRFLRRRLSLPPHSQHNIHLKPAKNNVCCCIPPSGLQTPLGRRSRPPPRPRD